MADDWARVAAALNDRLAELKLSKAEVQRRSGISQKTLDGYLAGQPVVRRDKERGLCEALRWTSRSIDLLRAGGDPEPLPDRAGLDFDERLSRVEAQVEEIAQLLRRMDIPPRDGAGA